VTLPKSSFQFVLLFSGEEAIARQRLASLDCGGQMPTNGAVSEAACPRNFVGRFAALKASQRLGSRIIERQTQFRRRSWRSKIPARARQEELVYLGHEDFAESVELLLTYS